MPRKGTVLFAGTFDPRFGRNRRLRTLLERAGFEVVDCSVEVWGTDRYKILDTRKLRVVTRALRAYAQLCLRMFRVPPCNAIFVCYPGWFDVLILTPFARLRRVPLIFDPFISLYDTIVSDRQLATARSLVGRTARLVDRVCLRLPQLVLADTDEHAAFFADLSGRPRSDFEIVPLGADDAVFATNEPATGSSNLVLFYGNFIPLHGVPTIIRAAKALETEGVRFRIIGGGQEYETVRALIAGLSVSNVELVDRVELEELPRQIAESVICLGIFGTSAKAQRVVPHKVYECMAAGRPVVTADTPAIRSAFAPGEIVVVRAGDHEALANALRTLLADESRRRSIAQAARARYVESYSETALVPRVRDVMCRVLRSSSAVASSTS